MEGNTKDGPDFFSKDYTEHCAEIVELLEEIAHLKLALAEDRSKWSLDTLLYVACEILKEDYPRHSYMIPAKSTGEEFVAALRDRLKAMGR